MKFSIKDFFSICDQIRRFLRIWSYLLKKSLMENFILCAVKFRPVSRATVDDMRHYLKPLLQKSRNTIILHVCTNDFIKKSSGFVLVILLIIFI